MSEELKVCPFCGSDAAVIFESGRIPEGTKSRTLWMVLCGVCGAGYEGLSLEYGEVIRHWNRRV